MVRKEVVAVDVLNNVSESLNSYFTILSKLGYKKDSEVNKLIIYSYLGDMLTGDMRVYISEDDYRNIDKALYCLYGSSCLIPYPKYLRDDNLFGVKDSRYIRYRVAEDSNILFTESLQPRLPD